MRNIIIGNQELQVKDYYCSYDGEYLDRPDGELWLYVYITHKCNGTCRFCINSSIGNLNSTIDPTYFRKVFRRIKGHIYGVSLTGGEPMLYPDLSNQILGIVKDECGDDVEIDMVTNGTSFGKVLESLNLRQLDSLHLSRHRISDADNDRVFGLRTVSAKEIAEVIQKMDDPAQLVLNCVLMSDGIDSVHRMGEYLEFASGLGVRNVSFIGLSRHNDYCKRHFIDPGQLSFMEDLRFHIWNKFSDHEYCSCSSGSYDSRNGSIRFYYRRVGNEPAPYARQLVYTADNRLLAGFSGKEIRFD